MAVGVTQEYSLAGLCGPVDPRRPETTQRSLDVRRLEPGLDMPEVVGPGVGRVGPAIRRRLIVKEFHPRAGRASKRGNPDPGAGRAAETFLLGTPVLTAPVHLKAEPVTIEAQAGFDVGHRDRGVIDAEKQAFGGLPAGVSFARREADHFQGVPVGVAYVGSFDASCAGIPFRQALGRRAGVADPKGVEPVARRPEYR